MVGAIASAGLMGGLALVLAQMHKQQLTLQKKTQTTAEVEALEQRIGRTLYNREACLNTVRTTSTGAATTITGTGTSVNLGSIRNVGDTAIVEVANTSGTPTYGNGLVRVNSIAFDVDQHSPGSSARITMEVTMEKTARAITGYRLAVQSYSLALELDSSNRPTGCESDLTAALLQAREDVCNELWRRTPASPNPPWNGTSCTPSIANQSCASNTFPIGFDNNGNILCVAAQGADPHPPGYNCYLLTAYPGKFGQPQSTSLPANEVTPFEPIIESNPGNPPVSLLDVHQRLIRWQLKSTCNPALPPSDGTLGNPPLNDCDHTFNANSFTIQQCPSGYQSRFINPNASADPNGSIAARVPGAEATYMQHYCCR